MEQPQPWGWAGETAGGPEAHHGSTDEKGAKGSRAIEKEAIPKNTCQQFGAAACQSRTMLA
jgi:hypothetical protein